MKQAKHYYTTTEIETTLDLVSDIKQELEQEGENVTLTSLINYLNNLVGRE